jgi:hypothetical protein
MTRRTVSSVKKLLTFAALALATAAVAVAPGTAGPQQAPKKIWLCHKTGATFTTNAGTFSRFAAIWVRTRAQARAHTAHGDVVLTPAPTSRAAARAACAALRVPAPITPTNGGLRLGATLNGGGVTADLTVRTQAGQRRLCFTLDVTVLAGSTVELTSLTLTHNSTTVMIPSAELSGPDPSGCMTLGSRTLAKELAKGGFTATLIGTVGGTAFQATGTLSK